MTLEQALSRQPDTVVLETDDQSYRKVFNQALASLQGISDRVERSHLGVAYAGLDGLEDMYGLAFRLGLRVQKAVRNVEPDCQADRL